MSKIVIGLLVIIFSAITVKAGIQTVFTCEHSEVTVTCPVGKVLDVCSAFYGQREPHRCDYSGNITCVAEGSLEKIKRICQDQNICTLSANNRIFGDPCHGVLKYARMDYKCVDHVRYKPRKAIVCEDRSITISCRADEVIIITKGFYGRDDGVGCPGNIFTTNCAADGSLDILRATCNNKQSCTISARSDIFGDPCLYTAKLIRIEYYCVQTEAAPAAIQLRRALACEQSADVKIRCPIGQVIIVAEGFYGRDETQSCPGNVYTTYCKAEDSSAYLTCNCNNEISCLLQASSKVFGDPCINTDKFIKLDYYCAKPPNQNLVVACEQNSVSVQCPEGMHIAVEDGFYGRDKDVATCPGGVLTTDCVFPDTLATLKEICDNRNTCNLHASNSVFGDPCLHTNKLIKMYYTCV